MAVGRTVHNMPLQQQVTRAELGQARVAQQIWSRLPLRNRLSLLRKARHRIAATATALAQSVPLNKPGALHRNLADTLASEVLPLAEACRFLESEAGWILAPQTLSNHQRPFWLRKVTAETRREPLGVVLIIAPANYPLFLPGVQALQALAAGNAVLWKPAPGGRAAAEALRHVLHECGLDPGLLQVLDEASEAATHAIQAGVDKVFLTGSAVTGEAVLMQLAEQATPAVMELSGCDAVFVLPGAPLDRVIAALAFGLRLNGSATCMAPRRLFVVGEHPGLLPALLQECERLPLLTLPMRTRSQLDSLLDDARRHGGEVLEEPGRFTIITGATAAMNIARSDVFAPVLSVFAMPDVETALEAHSACPYALTAAIFGPESQARAIASRLQVGTVLINDLIVATADPRIAFGGRKASGFGVTRGREGLLEMTTLKTIVTQRARDQRAYTPTTSDHEPFFAAYLQAAHGGTWITRWKGLRRFLRAAANLG